MNGWLNLYKPKGISSARAVGLVKKYLKGSKIGHTGTLDLEAEGVLPLAIGQATKLVSVLMDSRKTYVFTVQFGVRTDTGDAAGKVIGTSSYIPPEHECVEVCKKFTGKIQQTPPAYSALKVGGVRSYKLAREGKEVILASREITIYSLKCTNYDRKNGAATYLAECSKGTYIRTLAEDIALSLQSLGFVIKLRRIRVGVFDEKDSINAETLILIAPEEATRLLQDKCLKIEYVLDDIPALNADIVLAQKIAYGQQCFFDVDQNYDLVWVRSDSKIIAIGSLHDKYFKSSRVFNYLD